MCSSLLLWATLSLAATDPSPTSTPPAEATAPAAAPADANAPAADAPAAPPPVVIPAVPTPCGVDLPALVQRVTAGDDLEASVCMAAVEEAGPALIASIQASGPGAQRLGSALALWRLQRLDVRIPDVEARLFSPADRRMLRDGVQARKGRASPSPEHAALFGRFSWYKPVAGFTPGRLTAQDRENMATLDKPPPEPKPVAPAAEAMAEAQAPEPPQTEGACGCASSTGGASAAGLALALALGARRRRSTLSSR